MATDTLPTSQKTGKSKASATASSDPAVKEKRKAKPRITYPGLIDPATGEATVKLEVWPTDYDARIHKGVSRKVFKNEAPFLRHQADVLQKRVDDMRKEANECEKLGSAADRAKAKKLRHMRATIAKIEADLRAQGIDVSDLEGAEPEAAPTATPTATPTMGATAPVT